MEESQDLVRAGLRHVAELCTVAAITAPKSGGPLFLKGAKPFLLPFAWKSSWVSVSGAGVQ